MTCRIRPYRADDAQALYEAARESIQDVFPWLEWCHPDYSIAEATEWTSRQAGADSSDRIFAVVGPNDELLGGCGVNQINPLHRFGNLGYWVRSSATGRGMTKCAALEFAPYHIRVNSVHPGAVATEILVLPEGQDVHERFADLVRLFRRLDPQHAAAAVIEAGSGNDARMQHDADGTIGDIFHGQLASRLGQPDERDQPLADPDQFDRFGPR